MRIQQMNEKCKKNITEEVSQGIVSKEDTPSLHLRCTKDLSDSGLVEMSDSWAEARSQ